MKLFFMSSSGLPLHDTIKNGDEKSGPAEDQGQPSGGSLMDIKLPVEFKVTKRKKRNCETSERACCHLCSADLSPDYHFSIG